MKSGPVADEAGDRQLDRALTDALRAEPMDEVTLVRMRIAVERAWREDRARRRRARLRAWLPVAAAIALAIGGGWLATATLRPHAEFGSMYVAAASVAPGRGTPLRVGTRLVAPGNLRIALRSGGRLRAQAGSTLELVGASRVQLVRGVLYFDSDGREANAPFQVATPRGLVEHVGTQFEVTVTGTETRVRVREGAVQLPDGMRIGSGEQVMVSSDGVMRRSAIAPYDAEWRWIETAAPAVAVEGRPLAQLLRWVARETGRRLEFADDGSSTLSERTLLHGSVAGLPPELALRAMLVTTSLDADVGLDSIVVHKRRAQPNR